MNYVELAIKSGGFMEMDRVFLNNRLATLSSDQEKLAFIMPPASVVNAYFSEIYQKQGPDAAIAYFLDLVTTFDGFCTEPSFALEGSVLYPTFRVIRLNLLGKSFGFAFEDKVGNARVFSELCDEPVTDAILFEIAQLFPQYVIQVANGQIKLVSNTFGEFEQAVELSGLTTKSENAAYIKLTTLSVEDALTYYEELTRNCEKFEKMVQFNNRQFSFYIRK